MTWPLPTAIVRGVFFEPDGAAWCCWGSARCAGRKTAGCLAACFPTSTPPFLSRGYTRAGRYRNFSTPTWRGGQASWPSDAVGGALFADNDVTFSAGVRCSAPRRSAARCSWMPGLSLARRSAAAARCRSAGRSSMMRMRSLRRRWGGRSRDRCSLTPRRSLARPSAAADRGEKGALFVDIDAIFLSDDRARRGLDRRRAPCR